MLNPPSNQGGNKSECQLASQLLEAGILPSPPFVFRKRSKRTTTLAPAHLGVTFLGLRL
jgi:hypothetical protein